MKENWRKTAFLLIYYGNTYVQIYSIKVPHSRSRMKEKSMEDSPISG